MLGMLKGLGVSKYLIGGLALTLAITLGGGYLVVKAKNKQIVALTTDVATAVANTSRLEGEIGVQNQSILRLEETRKEDQRKMLVLTIKNREAAREVKDLQDKFRRHDLDNLSLKKPGLIENIINKGTKKVFRDLEDLTDPQKKEGQ